METPTFFILIVADCTAGAPALLDRVSRRAARGPCDFTLLVPAREGSARGGRLAERTLRSALAGLGRAAGRPVTGIVGPAGPLLAVRRTLEGDHFDEVIVSTLPRDRSRWLARDLPRRIERDEVPVVVVESEPSGA